MSDFAGLTLNGANQFGNLGRTVTSAGDLNGDSFDDALVVDTSNGLSYVVYGGDDLPATLSSDEIDGTNGFFISNTGAAQSSFGLGTYAVSMGDINGDGIDDLAIAARSSYNFDNDGEPVETVAYVIYGSQSGFGAELQIGSRDGSNGFRIDDIGGNINGLLNLGDVNGDGVNDLGISQTPSGGGYGPPVAVFSDDISIPVAAALSPDDDYLGYVMFGGANLSADGADGAASVLDLDGANGFGILAEQGGGGFYGEIGGPGGAITALGDVNGDGFGDLLVENGGGGYYEIEGPGGVGTQYIVYGTDGGFGDVLDPSAGGANIQAVDYSNVGRYSYAADVVAIGDVNGDGFDDFALTDPGRNGFFDPVSSSYIQSEHGVVHVVYGSAAGPVTTVSEAGVSDASEGFSIFDTGNPNNFERFGEAVAGVGDINGDGIDDFAIGNSSRDVGEATNVGEVTLVFGRATGFDRFIDTEGLSAADANALGYTFQGLESTFTLGEEISAAGDINGDGFGDFIIGNPSGGDSGQSFIVFGGSTLLELADNADGTDDNTISLSNLGASLVEGVPTEVSIDDFQLVREVEGDSGTTQIEFTLRRSGDLNRDVSVDFAVTGAGLFAADGDDFAGGLLPSGTVSFQAGAATATLTVDVAGDTEIEPGEDFAVTISNLQASGDDPASIGEATAFGRIDTDDRPPSISVRGESIFEDDTNLVFTITRTGDVTTEATVDYILEPFPASGGLLAVDADDVGIDLPTIGSVTFAAGETTQTVLVPVFEDSIIEARESLSLTVTAVTSDTLYDVTVPRGIGTIRNDDGRPPVIPPGVESDVFGDPHIVTLDGLAYDFQAVGEYVLLETTASATEAFQIEARFEPVDGSDLVSLTTRMAVQTSAGLVEVDALAATPLVINGVATELALGEALDINDDGIDDVFNDGGDYQIRLVNGAEEFLRVGVADGLLNVCVFLQEAADGGSAGSVQGLMGNANGVTGDDFGLRDGNAIPADEIIDDSGVPRLSFDFLYGQGDFAGGGSYADSWSVEGASLFSDESPAFATGFPAASISVEDLPVLVRDAAEMAARASGLDPDVIGQAVFDAAVLDFALTGNETFLTIAGNIAAVSDTDSDPFEAPALPESFGIVQGTTSVAEGDSGSTTISFLVYRVGDDTGAAAIDYAISGVDPDDLVTTDLTGTLTFAPGETVQTVSVEVAGDTLNDGSDTLTVTITPQDPATRLSNSSASTEIVSDDFEPVVVNEIDPQDGVEDNAFTLDVSSVFEDANGDALTITATTDGGVPGSVEIVDGELRFQPDANAFGDVTITLTADDGNGGGASTTFDLSIAAVNDGPEVGVAISDQAVDEDNAVSFEIAADAFTDADGDDLTFDVALAEDAPVDARVSIDGTTVTVTPPDNFFGSIGVIVTAADPSGDTASQTVNVDVAAVNDVPIVAVAPETQMIDEDSVLTLSIADVFEDVDGDALSITAAIAGGAEVASAVINDGVLTVTPVANLNGEITVTLTASDGPAEVSTDFVLDVAAVNDGPVATDDEGFSVDEGQAVTIAAADLLGNDTDVEQDTLSIISVGNAANGSVELDVDGNVVFTADGTDGAASFSYTVSDGQDTDSASVSVTVNDVDEPTDPYADYRQGTEGRDFLFGSFFAPNQIFGAGGNDIIFGGFRDDALAGGEGNDLLLGSNGCDLLEGNEGNDRLYGGRHHDTLIGGEGHDRLYGQSGDDLLEGNEGNDRLYGGGDNDTLLGGAGNDRMYGQSGDDRLGGGAGSDSLWGGSGQDAFVFGEGDGADTIRDFQFASSWGWWYSRPGDTIELSIDGIDSFADLMATATQSGRSSVFDFGDGDSLVVRNTRLSQFDEDDFTFV